MEKEQMIERVQNTVRKVLNVNHELDDYQSLLEMGLDSLKTMQLIIEIEKGFHFTFEDEELLMSNFITVNRIVEIIEKKAQSESAIYERR